MTVATTQSSITVAATGASSYAFPFIGVVASDIVVQYTTAAGAQTTLSSGSYSVTINAPVTGQIWGVGGTISPNVPSNYSTGSFTITRTLPFTQTAQISNQGNQYPVVTESALDILEMQIQQVAARGGAYRSIWASGVVYNFGDMVQDGINGAYTNNIYVCASSNTSGVWATDLASGDWVLALAVQTLSGTAGYLPLSGGTISGNLSVSGTNTVQTSSIVGNQAIGGTLVVTGHTTFEGVTSTGSTGTGKLVYSASPTGTGTATWTNIAATNVMTLNGSPVLDKINIVPFTSSGTYTPSSGVQYIDVEIVATGGSGGNGNSGGGSGASSGTYARVFFTSAQVGSSQTVTIGAVGTPTTFGTLISCPSGNNGTQGSSSSGGVAGASSPSAATISSGIAIANIQGQAGGSGANPASGAVFYGGGGGANPLGLGGLLLIYGSAVNGLAGTGYGSGGGGAVGTGTGAAGRTGIVIITEYISA